MSANRQYIAIDLKSFYASVECVERGLSPLDTCLVVADKSRTQKTICLAVSPPMKKYGISSRPRLFEVSQKIRNINRQRGNKQKSISAKVLEKNSEIAIDYIVATPRMALYIDYSVKIYNIYLKYIAPEDIHVYSIDEVFIDITSYLKMYRMSAHDLAMKIIRSVVDETGIIATAGIGSNMYLCKIAMDIMAKKMPEDKDGVRIAELDEMSYRRELWTHQPITDFWRVGSGIAKKLAPYGLYTMGDIASCSLINEDLLYRILGVNAELLIDHAWGWEPVTMEYVKAYKPQSKCLSSGQVLHSVYTAKDARNVILEMADSIAMELVDKRFLTDQIVLTVGYDVKSLIEPSIKSKYSGKIKEDYYGRLVPAHAHGTIQTGLPTSSSHIITQKVGELFDKIINPELLIKLLTLTVNNLIDERERENRFVFKQMDLFADYEEILQKKNSERDRQIKERKRQEVILNLRKKYGKNVILTGLNYANGATQIERNNQIGGHKA